jgi:ZIP family zinc transporter
MENFLLAMGLTLFAGLSTGVGGLLAFLYKKTNTKILSISLGFSAGVMIYVSFVEIFAEARKLLVASLDEKLGTLVTVLSFFGGMFLIAVIDKLIPSYENPHESHKLEEMDNCNINSKNLMRTGLFTALAILIHNFPEGLASFTSVVSNPNLGIVVALAIAIHNIPEGIAVSIPVYCATGSKKKALGLSLLSGLSEPIGALVVMQFWLRL